MPVQRSNRVSAPAPAKSRAPSFWGLTIAPFLERRAAAILAVLLLAGAARIAATYNALSVTFDEPIHVACGLEYLTNHAYRVETQHPPLERAMGALPVYLSGLRTNPAAAREPRVPDRLTAVRICGMVIPALFPAVPTSNRVLALARFGVLPFFLIAALVVYEWSRWLFGKPAALLATAIFTLTPSVLAHAGVATTDIALTACRSGAFLSLLRWSDTPTPKRALTLGIWIALSLLSKFTTLIYLPAAAAAMLLTVWIAKRPVTKAVPAWVKLRVPTVLIPIAVVPFLIWAAYWFSFGTVTAWKSPIRVPAPELFDGIKSVLEHNQGGHPSFLLGEQATHGWWYFFPVALGVKTPLAILLLLQIGLFACRRYRVLAWSPVALAVGVLLPAMAGNINIGVRHVLPMYVSFALLAGLGLARLAEFAGSKPAILVLPAVLLIWLAAVGARQHPDYIAYFNEVASDHPEDFLSISDLDWGQELIRTSQRLKELHAQEISVMLWGTGDDQLRNQYGFPSVKTVGVLQPNPGWNLISPTKAAVDYGGWHRGKPAPRYSGTLSMFNRPWYDSLEPTERIGALLLYNIPPDFSVP